MRKLVSRLVVMFIVMFVSVQSVMAMIPQGWSYITYPYMYNHSETTWYYINEGNTQWVVDLTTGNWSTFNQITGGWHYFQWPYSYSNTSGHWNFWNRANTQYVNNLTTGMWTLLGEASGMALIPAGSFQMGDSFDDGGSSALPVHSVYVSAFYMDKYEVTNDKMVDVLNWAYGQGKLTVTSNSVTNAEGNDAQELLDLDDPDCRITWDGNNFAMKSTKGSGYPCVGVTWYGSVAFCNYRSQMEGRTACYNLSDWSCNWSAAGYRLPTESEWEKAARGGSAGIRFPWGDTIQHARANYYSSSSYSYDTSPTRGYHHDYDEGGYPYTSSVGSFTANGYGLYDMAGNIWEWCNDWYGSYPSGSTSNPHGPSSGSARVLRGGSWGAYASNCRVALRSYRWPDYGPNYLGFRAVLTPGQ
ncbi:MAG: SUMF1/EgtB/PvdO family nonheme iron enzyme [Kiritimatiellae bacterium]|nr:SUMF1/EgtB/PvdO family nonheme iron enzyme [Kiritimatiellia bacterium]